MGVYIINHFYKLSFYVFLITFFICCRAIIDEVMDDNIQIPDEENQFENDVPRNEYAAGLLER